MARNSKQEKKAKETTDAIIATRRGEVISVNSREELFKHLNNKDKTIKASCVRYIKLGRGGK